MVFHVEADVETPWKDVGNLYQSCDAFSDRQVHGLGASHSLLEAACTGKDSKSTPARQSLKATNDGAIDMARTTFAECFDSLWVDQYEENLPDLVYDLRTQFRRYKLFKTFLVGLVPTRIPCELSRDMPHSCILNEISKKPLEKGSTKYIDILRFTCLFDHF